MNRAVLFDAIEEQQKQKFADRFNELVGRESFRPELGKARNRSVKARIAWLVLMLVAAILCRVPKAGGATMEQPSVNGSTPSAAVSPSPNPTSSAAEWLAEGQRYLDAKDFAKALALFQKSAADGQAAAMDHLGLLYRDGKGVTQDYGEALQWFQKGSDAGSASAMHHLGWVYENGKGVQDFDKAREWLRKAIDAGFVDGTSPLAWRE